VIARYLDWVRHRLRLRRWNAEHALGRRGEDLAHRYLRRAGFTVVARNYRTRSGSGEIDLIAWDGDTLVFIEVKTRSTEDFGAPDRAVDADKRERLVRAAREYARRTRTPPDRIRFDVINVVWNQPPDISLIRAAFHPIALI
jgi:putative endonuclease